MSELNRKEISAMRRSYGEKGLSESDAHANPLTQFHKWLGEAAENSYIVEPNAMVLSTVSGSQPSSRTVLLKDLTDEGFTFFTNYESRKGREIAGNAGVSLLFPWYAMERQVVVIGTAKKVSAEASDEYFSTRPWSSQIGAWASWQSSELSSREELEIRYQEFTSKYPEGSTVPRPPHWGGFVVWPTSIEFWQGRYSRLHDRIRYTHIDGVWGRKRFYP